MPAGRGPSIASKMEQQEQELERRRTQEVQQGSEEINARCDIFYNSFYRRRHIRLNGIEVDELFCLFLPFI